jgi:hypothetical protein
MKKKNTEFSLLNPINSFIRIPFCLLPPAFCLLNFGQALALTARTIYSRDAQSNNSIGVDLKVWKGYGVTINFLTTGEIIKQVWIGDPSRFSLSSNGNLCQKSDSNQDCTSGGATVLFLRQIKPIDFANLTSSQDGSTQITVITSGSDGQKQYQFKLIPATGQPSYTSLIIKPDSERPSPITLVRVQPPATTKQPSAPQKTVTPARNQNVTVARSVSPSSAVPSSNSVQRNDANAIAYGLTVAVSNGKIKPHSSTWSKTQDAIRLLRQGKSREKAASLSGVPVSVFNQLIEWGQSR